MVAASGRQCTHLIALLLVVMSSWHVAEAVAQTQRPNHGADPARDPGLRRGDGLLGPS